jgi:hypothetical protein
MSDDEELLRIQARVVVADSDLGGDAGGVFALAVELLHGDRGAASCRFAAAAARRS